METKTFAFRLADKKPRETGKWQARDGIALAGCSRVSLQYWRFWQGYADNGAFC